MFNVQCSLRTANALNDIGCSHVPFHVLFSVTSIISNRRVCHYIQVDQGSVNY